MDTIKATDKYEAWLSERLTIVQSDLDYKHEIMAGDIFTFMRATFYRWMQLWFDEKEVNGLNEAPTVMSVGDIHAQNFGSWRDLEARLVWGINDFDEAYPLAYTVDLVRLVTSAFLALEDGYDSVPMATISSHVLAGYRSGLRQGGAPIVLAEERSWLRELIIENLKDPEQFWEKLTSLPLRTDPLPPQAQQAIEKLLPEPGGRYRVSDNTAGAGGRGRQRLLALQIYRGANAAREAKAATASAASMLWAKNKKGSDEIFYNRILDGAIRSPDPFVREFDGWVVRRLSPDYVRFDLSSLNSEKMLGQVLNAMGWETANVHLGTRDAIKDVRKDLRDRGEEWLPTAADRMLELLQDDFTDWSSYWLERQGS